MLAREIMTEKVVTVPESASVAEASGTLVTHEISAAPVVDPDGRVVGIVSDGDLLRDRLMPDPRAHLRPVDASGEGDPPRSVSAVMTTPVHTLPASADEAEILRLMLAYRIKSVPVVDAEHRVVGIVSRGDLLRGHTRSDDTLAKDVKGRLAELATDGDRWLVEVTDSVVTLAGPPGDSDRRLAVLVASSVPGVSRVHVRDRRPDDPRPGSEPGGSGADHRGIRVLALEECLEHLRHSVLGRIAFVHDGGPIILPVNHGVDGLDVVFRTTWGSKLEAAQTVGAAAFEVDGYDRVAHRAWSVLVTGRVETVYEPADVARLEALGVRAWPGGSEPFWVRVRADEISGRELDVNTTH